MLIAYITMNRNLNKNLHIIQEQTSGTQVNQDTFWIFKTRIKAMKVYQSFPKLILLSFFNIYTVRINIVELGKRGWKYKVFKGWFSVENAVWSWCKWTGSMLCKQWLTSDQGIFQRGCKYKDWLNSKYKVVSTFRNTDCISLRRQSELDTSAG